ncbi:MAG: CDP-diacylglycerol--glycerol-3-phosphate 3-phosphatidyltransferase [Paracoccaceae bacterium]
MTWNLPTFLTVLRLLAALGLPLAFLVLPRPYADACALVLFAGASITDWLDGYLARAWGQVTKLGAMLDPIADKAMVVIALFLLGVYSSLALAILMPAALILFREVFVSGLREYLGDTAGTLKVTGLAKWKTAAQMVAIAVLFAHGIFEHMFGMAILGMDHGLVTAILTGAESDEVGLSWKLAGMEWTGWGGLGLLWIAAVLTLLTGLDYFTKAWPHLKGD